MQDLVTFLHADGLITRSESLAIKKAARDLHENPVRILRSLNIASPKDIQKCFKVYFNFPLVTDSLVDHLTGEYASLIPVDLAIHYSVFGFGEEGNKLFVGMEDPSDRSTREALHFFLGKEIVASAANVYQLKRALVKLYGLDERSSGLETVLDRARGAGAWSETERALFEQILQERAAREEDERKSVTIVSVPNTKSPSGSPAGAARGQNTRSHLKVVPPPDPVSAEAENLEHLPIKNEAQPSPDVLTAHSAEDETLDALEPLSQDPPDEEQEPGYELAQFDESLLEPFDDDAFEAEPEFVDLLVKTDDDTDDLEDSVPEAAALDTSDEAFDCPSADQPFENIDLPALKKVAQRAQVKLALCKDIRDALASLNELLQPLAMAVLVGDDKRPLLLVNELPVEMGQLDTEIAQVLRPLFARLEHLAGRTAP